MTFIPLGFELGTGKAVNIPLRHTAVTGQTQESGKTTTLEALITRSGLRAICFVTKRGERSFSTGRAIMPYFAESADWQFVESILEATMRERMKFQRSWIMKVCQPYHGKDGLAPAGFIEKIASGIAYSEAIGIKRTKKKTVVKDFGWLKPKSLGDVAKNIEVALLKARGLNESVYRELKEYLQIVIPQIKALPKGDKVDLKPGINVMWLDEYSQEMQSLIIRSVLEWIVEKESNTITVIPEAWNYLPQGRSSPVLLACEHLIRQGAANKNYIWLDSQDIAGVHKSILRQVAVWILGVQREIHETERTLEHIPGGSDKPSINDIMRLGKGQFYVVFGSTIAKTYVWPVWLSANEAVAVAYAQLAPPPSPRQQTNLEDEMHRERAEAAEKRVKELETSLAAAMEEIKALKEKQAAAPIAVAPGAVTEIPIAREASAQVTPGAIPMITGTAEERAQEWMQNVFPLIRDAAMNDPVVLRVFARHPEIQIACTQQKIEISDQTLRGKLAILLSEGFFDNGQAGYAAFVELKRRGAAIARPSVYNELNAMAKLGFVTIEQEGSTQAYRRVPGIAISKTSIATA